MKAIFKPSQCKGSIKIPPSKSMAHRAIICASLSKGTSILSNIDYSDDILTTIEGMRKLGAVITCEKDYVVVEGVEEFSTITEPIDCCESGSTLRFLIPIFSLTQQKVKFIGRNRLLKRPQSVYQEIFEKEGLYFHQDEDCIEIQGALHSNSYTLKGNISSQFISGLLFTLPLVDHDSTIHILPPFESKSYIDLTISMLSKFGIDICWQDDLTLSIKGNQSYQPTQLSIEGDFSQFAFFGVLGAISSSLSVCGLDFESAQGDKQILDIMHDFKVSYEIENDTCTISPSSCVASEIDLQNCPDLGPILCILAMFSKGSTKITHASRLRLKESDRILAMKSECAKMGCVIEDEDDCLVIHGGYHQPNVCLDGWKDHRIVMACSVALSVLGGSIEGCEAVTKSYPSFFDDLKALGIEVDVVEG